MSILLRHSLALCLTLSLASVARADHEGPERTPRSAPKTIKVRVVGIADNGMGQTFTVKTSRGKKLRFMFPPDGSSKPVEGLKKGERIELTYATSYEKRVADVRLKGKKLPKRVGRGRDRRKKVHRVEGVFKKKTQGDMGSYVELTRNGKDESWLGDFELSGGLDFEKAAGKQIVLTYLKSRMLEYISHKKLD